MLNPAVSGSGVDESVAEVGSRLANWLTVVELEGVGSRKGGGDAGEMTDGTQWRGR